ncbi:cbb3-type cytochrome oxidase assembly protein CcoS [Thiomicrorhabdus sp.]|uniref:cbb3-type cytochrome oxidase assembly protein CcoS n=1 Tax=Thiomicrorhabdus sp. TaxID=2039724 RepID=UPI0029C692AD|nr:cbb3-type cytochrome oxidase assembly protein CcoS [Thiomicrorhabdus sp.]
MDVIYGLIPMMLFFGFLVVVVFIWMAKKGYFDDMDGQASRILMDDDDFEAPEPEKNPPNADDKPSEITESSAKTSVKR